MCNTCRDGYESFQDYDADSNRFGLPVEPTHHLPGTPEKLLAMRKRAETGSVFHPQDARHNDLTPGITYLATILEKEFDHACSLSPEK